MSEMVEKTLFMAISIIGLVFIYPFVIPVLQDAQNHIPNPSLLQDVDGDIERLAENIVFIENSKLDIGDINNSYQFQFSEQIFCNYDNPGQKISLYFFYNNISVIIKRELMLNKTFIISGLGRVVDGYSIGISNFSRFISFD